MDIKKYTEEVLVKEFVSLLKYETGRCLSIVDIGEKPDVICKDADTNKIVGIEIIELLSPQIGRARSLSRQSSEIVTEVLEKYAPGGTVSIGYGTIFPQNKEERNRLKNALDSAIKQSGNLQTFSQEIRIRPWKFMRFIISNIFIKPEYKNWRAFTDAPLAYQTDILSEESLIQAVREKVSKAVDYRKVDELLLLIRNPHSNWEPSENMMKEIAKAKGKRIDSVWLINWKMDSFPVQTAIIRIDC